MFELDDNKHCNIKTIPIGSKNINSSKLYFLISTPVRSNWNTVEVFEEGNVKWS